MSGSPAGGTPTAVVRSRVAGAEGDHVEDRDPVAWTGMGVLTGTWAVVGASTLTAPPGASSPGLDAVLLVAALCLLVPAAAARGTLVAVTVRGAPVEEVSAVEHEAGVCDQP